MSWKECQWLVGGTVNCIIQPFCGLAPMWSAHQNSKMQLSGVWHCSLRRTAVATFFPKSMAFKWNIFLGWLKNCLVQGFLILRICIFCLSETWHLSSICLYCLGQCACFSFHWVLVFWPEGCLFKNYGWRRTVNHKWLYHVRNAIPTFQSPISRDPDWSSDKGKCMDDSGQSHDLCVVIVWWVCLGSWPTTGSFSPLGGILMCFRELPNFSSFLFQNP